MSAMTVAEHAGRTTPDEGLAAVPCVARPSAGLVHRDGACRCFAGGPAPEFAPPARLAPARSRLRLAR